jgi:hypothetical protein
MSKQNRPALIVFGKRPRKHPRAAWFAAADAAVARWIAQQYGLSILKATARVINQLGNPVAEWQLSPRGQPMVPTVKSGTFEELKALANEAGVAGEPGIEAGRQGTLGCVGRWQPGAGTGGRSQPRLVGSRHPRHTPEHLHPVLSRPP